METLQSFSAERLASELGQAKKSGTGWVCSCPAHDDRQASLSISEGIKRPLVYHCHAGCSFEAITKALAERGLLPATSPKALVSGGVVSRKVVRGNFRRQEPTATYVYRRADGSQWFQVLRYDSSGGKDIRIRYLSDSGQWVYKKPSDAEGALYGLVKLNRLRGKVPVLVCEGEKNCDFLHGLLGDDFAQVTNAGGAKNWKVAHGEQLGDCEVIIVEDCDDAGRWRSRLIAKSLPKSAKLLGVLRFSEEEVSRGGDVQDWVELGKGDREALLARLRTGLEQIEDISVRGREKKEDASRRDYIQLYTELFGNIKRDLFTDSAVSLVDGVWVPVVNRLEEAKSEASERSRTGDKRFYSGQVIDHLYWFCRQLERVIVPEIPEWDGEDRLLRMAQVLHLKPDTGLTGEIVAAVLKEWMANLWRKWRDPSMTDSPSREFIFILQGPQKIGKDYWLKTLLGALGQWFTDFSISSNERDNLMQVHENAVLNISEFDRTNRMESAMIKDLITKKNTKLRSAYSRESQFRESRCSFVASVNPLDILRDSSGNSRYCIIPLIDITRCYRYSLEYSAQCLAQGRTLADIGYVAPDKAWEAVNAIIEEGTPLDPAEEIAEWWFDHIGQFITDQKTIEFSDCKWSEIEARGFISKADAEPLLEKCCRVFGLPRRTVYLRLSASGIGFRQGNARNRMLKTRK